ncbi:hypothetical protein V8C44DRAFT_345409 [Trichoderma aethiopicum]
MFIQFHPFHLFLTHLLSVYFFLHRSKASFHLFSKHLTPPQSILQPKPLIVHPRVHALCSCRGALSLNSISISILHNAAKRALALIFVAFPFSSFQVILVDSEPGGDAVYSPTGRQMSLSVSLSLFAVWMSERSENVTGVPPYSPEQRK